MIGFILCVEEAEVLQVGLIVIVDGIYAVFFAHKCKVTYLNGYGRMSLRDYLDIFYVT